MQTFRLGDSTKMCNKSVEISKDDVVGRQALWYLWSYLSKFANRRYAGFRRNLVWVGKRVGNNICEGYYTVARKFEFFNMFSWQEQYLTRSLILFLPREHKIHIFKLTCNFLFITRARRGPSYKSCWISVFFFFLCSKMHNRNHVAVFWLGNAQYNARGGVFIGQCTIESTCHQFTYLLTKYLKFSCNVTPSTTWPKWVLKVKQSTSNELNSFTCTNLCKIVKILIP